jgi:4-amino-4-deoxy-L-arabinose transferase-like glycosyltransferase
LTVFYVLSSRHLPLRGDEIEYDIEGRFIAIGHPFWTTTPYGIAHPSAWKAPGYPAFVGLIYRIFGPDPLTVRLLQTPLAGLDVLLAHRLGARLFDRRVALAGAFLVAVYPMAWQYTGLLYPEALATPLYLAVALLVAGPRSTRRHPTALRAVLIGLLVGITVLVRPASILLLPAILVALGLAAGWRRGLALTAVSVAGAVVVVASWTIRNAIVLHGFVPVSLEEAAAYGTFNAFSAHYAPAPYAWQPSPPPDAHFFDPRHPLPDITLYDDLQHAALSYVRAHPFSVVHAFFWNGITRLWDLRGRQESELEVPFEGRSPTVTRIGLDLYDVLLPLGLLGLWRARRQRRILVAALLTCALAASLVYTADAGTRYRAPFEPVIALMACVGLLGA